MLPSLQIKQTQLVFGISVALIASRLLWAPFEWSFAGTQPDISDVMLMTAVVVAGFIYYQKPAVRTVALQAVDSNRYVAGSLLAFVLMMIISALTVGDGAVFFSTAGSAIRVVT